MVTIVLCCLLLYHSIQVMAPAHDTSSMGRTTIQVSDELADELYQQKNRGDSYEDVIWRLLDGADE